MNNKDNHPTDEEQSAAMPTDYRVLLAMTRPLVVAEHTLPSWRGGEICDSRFGISLEPEDWRLESVVSRGEIVRPDRAEPGTTGEEGPATGIEEATSSTLEIEQAAARVTPRTAKTDSNLQIRIYLGMS
jgi:hypothetical protein